MTVLEFDAVTKVYSVRGAGQITALDDVSFTLRSGRTIGLVGQSGSGKSTIAKILTQLETPTSGEVRLDGQPIPRRGAGLRAYRQQLRMVFQDPFASLNPYHSIRYHIQRPLRLDDVVPKAEVDDEVRRLLERVRLDPDAVIDRRPHELSGGQRQRVAIARALASRPKLLVADEPVSMLDASVRVEILKLLRGLQVSHNLAVIYITHDLSTVRYFSERIFVMYAGRVVEKAEVPQLLNNAGHPYTHALLAATSDPDAQNALTFKEVPPGEPPSLINPPSGCRFHPRCPHMIENLCEVEDPPDFELGARHFAACWLHREEA
jgi:oligopeptide/dipeptide ABC transporter ATP-binding protein